MDQCQPIFTTFEFNDIEVIKLKENGIQGLKKFRDDGLHEDFIYDHLHYEWIKSYEKFNIDQIDKFPEDLNEYFLKNCDDLDKDIHKIVHDISEAYNIYMQEIDGYINAKIPSVDSCKNLLKYTSFLSCYKSKFYIDAETGYFGCTIKKKIGRKKKSIDLLFKSNYEIIYCLTRNMNNLIYLRGIADFDDDLEDVKAIRWLLDY